jgi:hypothetical protein
MDKRLETRLYDRLTALTQGDEGRLMDYLQGAATGADRRARHEARRKSEGYQRVPIWVHADELAELRTRYPGPRGGVDWAAVVRTALGGADHADK